MSVSVSVSVLISSLLLLRESWAVIQRRRRMMTYKDETGGGIDTLGTLGFCSSCITRSHARSFSGGWRQQMQEAEATGPITSRDGGEGRRGGGEDGNGEARAGG